MIPPLGDRILLLIDRETTESVFGVRCFPFCFPSLLVPQETVAIPFDLLNKEQENQVIGRVEQSLISLSLLPEILLKVTWFRAQSCPENILFSGRILSPLGQERGIQRGIKTPLAHISEMSRDKEETASLAAGSVISARKRVVGCRLP